MKWRPSLAFLLMTMLAAACGGGSSGRQSNPPPPAASLKRLLVVTQAAGFQHAVTASAPGELSLVESTIRNLATVSGDFEVVTTRDAAASITAQNLATFDGVFFFTSGELPLSDAQKQALLDFVQNGKGFAAAHSATDTFYTWPEYGLMLGAYFESHPWNIFDARIEVEDFTHPSTAALGSAFILRDEIYVFAAPYDRSRLHVLMHLDVNSTPSSLRPRADGDYALAWTRTHGQGRVFYTALGHPPEVWNDVGFQSHLLGGLRWSLRLTP